MHRLIYVSRSLVAGDQDAVAGIVRTSAVRNAAAGITGMLWSDGGYFVQALEGNVDAVAVTFGRILSDRRHIGVEIVVNRAISLPMFGKWSMAEANDSEASNESAMFLLGLAYDEVTPAKRRLRKVIHGALQKTDS